MQIARSKLGKRRVNGGRGEKSFVRSYDYETQWAHLCWLKTYMVYNGLYDAMYTFYIWNLCSPKGQNKSQWVEMPGKHM